MSIIDDFSSIGARLSEIEKKIPKPESDTVNPLAETIVQEWTSSPTVVWTPEHGYATIPLSSMTKQMFIETRNLLCSVYPGCEGGKEPN